MNRDRFPGQFQRQRASHSEERRFAGRIGNPMRQRHVAHDRVEQPRRLRPVLQSS